MILSAIDLGTNTVLMVTLEQAEDGDVRVLADDHNIARLGRGVDSARTIAPDAFERVAGFLEQYRVRAESLGAGKIVAAGTSALRDAANREEFIEAMQERTGIALEVLSGDDEARLTYRGALFALPVESIDSLAVLDIGGGSTEVAVGHGTALARGSSLDVGAVRVTERVLGTGRPAPEQIAAARALVRSSLAALPSFPPGTRLVGVAGTVTTLGTMALGLDHHDDTLLHGSTLTLDYVRQSVEAMARLLPEDLRLLRGVHPERADILLGGALILQEIMEQMGWESITVSTRGLRYGVALRELER